MTQEQELGRRTVQVKVLGHELHNNKPIVKLDIPSWKSKYPTTLYNVSDEDQAALPMGAELAVVLRADRQKDNTKGDAPWHYFWSFERIATPQEVADADAPPPAQATANEQPPEYAATRDPQPQPQPQPYQDAEAAKNRSIQKQVALKAAVELVVTQDVSGAVVPYVTETAQAFFDWLAK